MKRRPSMLQPRTGALSPAQKRLLLRKKTEMLSQAQRGQRALGLAAVACGILWLLTMLASDTAWEIITAFWILVGGGIVLWVHRDLRKESRDFQARVEQIQSAVERGEAEIFDISANAYVEFQEIEDEGACYAFDLEDGRVVFVRGQEFYRGSKFPSLDFSLIYPLDAGGRAVDMLIEKRAPAADPSRIVSSAVKKSLELPEHLAVIEAGLEQLEEVLSTSRS